MIEPADDGFRATAVIDGVEIVLGVFPSADAALAAVEGAMGAAGVQPRKPRVQPRDPGKVGRALVLRAKGWSLRQIAEDVGASRTAVMDWCRSAKT